MLKAVQGYWLAPGPMFAAYWAIFLCLPTILVPQFRVSTHAAWYIVLLIAAFSLGSFAASPSRPVRPAGVEPRPLNQRILRLFVAAGTAAGVLAAIAIQRANGNSLASMLSLGGLLDAASSIAEDRYLGRIATPAVVPLLLAVTYGSALIAPFAAEGLPLRRAVLTYVGPVIGATMYASATTARSGMVTAGAFLFAGWVASRVWRDGHTPILRFRTLLVGGAATVLILAAFILIAFLRVGSFSPHYQRLVFDKLAVYGLGYMPAFSHWFDWVAPAGPSAWGAASFAGVAKYIGGDARYGAALSDFADLGDGRTSNIFTAWRYLIEDFGWVGAPLAALVLGYVATGVWASLVRRPKVATVLVFMCSYGYLLHTNTLPIFTFTNVVVSVVMAGLVLRARAGNRKSIAGPTEVRSERRAGVTVTFARTGSHSDLRGGSS